jgi:hypothetical protein
LENKVFPAALPASCHELAQWGESENGAYVIQPTSYLEPFSVECNFDGKVGTTIIKVDHTGGITSTPLQSDGCAEPGCYTDTFIYNATTEQLTGLTSISSECSQYIIHNCTMNELTTYSWWTDRNGKQRGYWHGSYEDDTVGCYCSLEGDGCESAHFDDLPCNCDDFDEIDIDEGILSNKDQLPVSTLNYGDSESRYSWIIYKLGNMECKGKADDVLYPSEEAGADYHFKYYASSNWQMGGANTYVNLKEQAHDWSLGFYNAADGSFTAPVDGLYEFDLQLVFTHDARFRVYLKKDGIVKDELANYTEDEKSGHHSAHLSTQLTLKKNQVIRLVVDFNNKKDHTKTTNACRINQKQVGCSFFQGRLIARS